MNSTIVIIAFFLIISYYQSEGQTLTGSAEEQIKQADIEFSDYSRLHGFKEAFLKFMASDAVILRDNSFPIEGEESVRKEFAGDDGGYTLTWYPAFASVSASLELGYTYGLYEMSIKDEKGETSVRKGTYVTIWRKQNDSLWKFVFDTGHKGLEPPKN